MTMLELWRFEAGLSRAQLAEAAEVNRDTIRMVEEGKCRPRVGTAVRIGIALGRTALEVLVAAQTPVEGESA